MGAKGRKLLTVQKRFVAEVIEGMEGLFTARDLCVRLAARQAKVSRATAYRLLAVLCAEGEVLEFWLPGGKRMCARSRGNFHNITECENCGRLEYSASMRRDRLQGMEGKVVHTTIYRRVRCCGIGEECLTGYALSA